MMLRNPLAITSGLALLLAPAAAVADDDDASTDALGELKGSDRVSAEEGDLDRSRANVFEKERFFIDKLDTPDTEERTLFQGNLVSSTFYYSESGGDAKGVGGGVGAASQFSRLFTDLRAQLDARHIKGGRWQARLDIRGRVVTNPEDTTDSSVNGDTRVQSGLTGETELEVKELWITRPGDRFDLFFGRQYIADLGGMKIDGLRVDYAKSDRVTLLGFLGSYPLRGSRSIATDYPVLQRANGDELGRTPPIAAGAGAAYRTTLSYGSAGAGTVAPLKGEKPRVYVTSTGYLRSSSKLDLYHFALIDLVSEGGFAANNLSAGINYRPAPALRATLSLNHVDTETLEVQAQTFLEPADASRIRNDAALRRVSSTQAQAGLSASLGAAQEIEASVALAARYRPDLAVKSGAGNYTFTSSTSVDVLAQLVHRNLRRTRLGVDGVRSFSVGEASSRSSYLGLRAFASREFKQGRGSWEGEVGYTSTKDDGATGTLLFGQAKTSTLSATGTVYYRLKSALFLMGSFGVGSFGLSSTTGAMTTTDPKVTTLSAFLRAAYRF